MYETSQKPLTETKRLELGAELAALERTLIDVEVERKTVVSGFRNRIVGIRKKLDAVSHQLTEGFYDVRFEVVEVLDDDRFMVEIQRKDDGTRVSTRQMTELEKAAARDRKQGALFRETKENHGKPLTAATGELAKHAKTKRAKKGGK